MLGVAQLEADMLGLTQLEADVLGWTQLEAAILEASTHAQLGPSGGCYAGIGCFVAELGLTGGVHPGIERLSWYTWPNLRLPC